MRVFLDTNVLVSALMSQGLCRDLLERLIIHHVVVLGAPVRQELDRILRDRFHVAEALLDWMSRKLDELDQAPMATVDPTDIPAIPDPDDAPILASALAAGADLFVTGDKALLTLRELHGMPIVSPREAWMRLIQAR